MMECSTDDRVSTAFRSMFYFLFLCRCDMKMMVNQKVSENVLQNITVDEICLGSGLAISCR